MHVASSKDCFQRKFEEEFADGEDESGEGVGCGCEEGIYSQGVA